MKDSIKLLYALVVFVFAAAAVLFFASPKAPATPEPTVAEPESALPVGTRYALGGFFRFAAPPELSYEHAKGMIKVSNAAFDTDALEDGEYYMEIRYGSADKAPQVEAFETVFTTTQDVSFFEQNAERGDKKESEGELRTRGYFIPLSADRAVEISIRARSQSGLEAAEDALAVGWLWAPRAFEEPEAS